MRKNHHKTSWLGYMLSSTNKHQHHHTSLKEDYNKHHSLKEHHHNNNWCTSNQFSSTNHNINIWRCPKIWFKEDHLILQEDNRCRITGLKQWFKTILNHMNAMKHRIKVLVLIGRADRLTILIQILKYMKKLSWSIEIQKTNCSKEWIDQRCLKIKWLKLKMKFIGILFGKRLMK